MGEAIYGISCALDKKTGQAIISDENKEKVKKLYDKYIEYLKKHLTQKDFKKKMKNIQLCFHLAVSGDYETCHKKLILDEDWQDEEEDDDIKEMTLEEMVQHSANLDEYDMATFCVK